MSKDFIQRAKSFKAKLLWLLGRFKIGLLGRSDGIEQEVKLVRSLLRRSPCWKEGHLRLGMLKLAEQRAKAAHPDPRDIAAISVSAEAVHRLLGDTSIRTCPERAAAYYLQGMAAFISKRHEEALGYLEKAIGISKGADLPGKLRQGALEYAGAAAMSLGRDEQAEAYFSAIPEGERNAEVLTALDYLRGSVKESA